MREKTSKKTKKGVRNAHLLLGAYWGYRVLKGGSIPKTTLEVLNMERKSVLKEKRKEMTAKQKDRQEPAAREKKGAASAALTGIAKNTVLRKAAKKILRNARVI